MRGSSGVCSLLIGLLRMRKHSPECGDRVTARAQTCLPSIALATEGLRTPWTAFAVVISLDIGHSVLDIGYSIIFIFRVFIHSKWKRTIILAPLQGAIRFFLWSGGIARLNPRLLSLIPPGWRWRNSGIHVWRLRKMRIVDRAKARPYLKLRPLAA